MYKLDQEEYLGWAFINSLITYTNEPYQFYEYTYEFFTGRSFTDSDFKITESEIREARSRMSKFPEDKLEQFIMYMCTVKHENTHIKQASSSTACLWLILNHYDLYLKLYITLKEMSNSGIETIYQPFKKYLKTVDKYSHKSLRQFNSYYDSFSFNNNTFTGRHVYKMKELLQMQERYNGKSCITNLNDTRYSSPANLTLSHLLEVQARMADYSVMSFWREAGVSEKILERIARKLYGSIYFKALMYFEESLNQRKELTMIQKSILFMIALHISLFPHLIYPPDEFPGKQKWEDIQPCWRFQLIINKINDMQIPLEPQFNIKSIIQEICEAYEWVSPIDQAKASSTFEIDGIKNILVKDLYRRHMLYCSKLVDNERDYGTIYADILSNNETFEPWLNHDGKSIKFYSVKDEKDRVVIFTFCMTMFIYEELLHKNHFNASREVFMKANRYLLDNGEVKRHELDSQFMELFKYATKYSLDKICKI